MIEGDRQHAVLDRRLHALQPFELTADKPVLVAQYSVARVNMLIAEPITAHREVLYFSVHESISDPGLTVVAPNAAMVQLGVDFISDWMVIGNTGFKVAYIELPEDGVFETLTSTEPISAHVAGAGAWHQATAMPE